MTISDRLIFRTLRYLEEQEQLSKIGNYEKPKFKEYTPDLIQHHLKECADKGWLSGGMKNEIGDYLAIGKLTMGGHRKLEELREKFSEREVTKEIIVSGVKTVLSELEKEEVRKDITGKWLTDIIDELVEINNLSSELRTDLLREITVGVIFSLHFGLSVEESVNL